MKDLKRLLICKGLKGEVISSTFDEPAQNVAVAEMVIEKAKRLTEHKKDVVILLDSITRLGLYAVIPSSGKVLTGGVDANALSSQKIFWLQEILKRADLNNYLNCFN